VADVFYEVDEQLRSARLQTLFRRGWPYAAGLIALVLVAALAVWGWRAHEAAAAGESSQRYADAMQALGVGDAKNAGAKFAKLAQDGTPAYRALALMQEAGLKVKANDAKGAADLYDQAAAAAHDPITVDGAKLRAAFLLMDGASYADIRARLEPLTDAKRPFRMLAREGLAIAKLANGRTAEAKGDFQVLALSPDVSDATRARANAALGLIQAGSAANLGAIAKAAAGLKPTPKPQGLTPEQAAALAQMQGQGGGQGAPNAQPSGAPSPDAQPAPGAAQ
jgi:hypothetical protein